MDLIVGLFVLALIGISLVGAFFLVAFIWAALTKDKPDPRVPAELAKLFNGRSRVSYQMSFGSLTYEQVVMGGIERGYTLTHDSGDKGLQTLIFTLTDPTKLHPIPTAPLLQALPPTASPPG